jgi:hypothetical protein
MSSLVMVAMVAIQQVPLAATVATQYSTAEAEGAVRTASKLAAKSAAEG